MAINTYGVTLKWGESSAAVETMVSILSSHMVFSQQFFVMSGDSMVSL